MSGTVEQTGILLFQLEATHPSFLLGTMTGTS